MSDVLCLHTMKFQDLVSVSGLSGLYQLVGSRGDGAIVKNFDDGKTSFISARKHEVTPLDSIEVFTQTDNIALRDVFLRFMENEPSVDSMDVLSKGKEDITTTFAQLFPDYDKDRVYLGDMKKMIKWYLVLKKLDLLEGLKETESEEEAEK